MTTASTATALLHPQGHVPILSLLSSILGLLGAPVLQSGPDRGDLGTGQSRLCCPIAAWANSQLLILAKTLIFFPFSCMGAVIQSWLLVGG